MINGLTFNNPAPESVEYIGGLQVLAADDKRPTGRTSPSRDRPGKRRSATLGETRLVGVLALGCR